RIAGMAFPAPGESTEKGKVRLCWWGAGQAMLIGSTAAKVQNAALIDQSDAWAGFELKGPAAAEALARLVPLDTATMAEGATKRSLLGHMPLALLRTAEGFRLYTFRSMAKTAWAELSHSVKALAARSA
ncbi:sarcosine oxidase subunit gamma, partial [Vannielia litorea]|uniref:sarcosine oxidase subunit gamma n=1 Tax=Vannielia litorea TaxID=1217970 RepID=UPI001BD138F4